MRVLCWGTYDTGKPRTRILHQGLRLAGVDVTECHVELWQGIEDKSQVKGRLRRFTLLLRWIASYPRLVWKFMRARRPDLVLIGFPGILDALVIAPLARLRGVPVAWDMFMSLYDTVVLDRRLLAPGSVPAKVLRALEGFAIRRCDLVFLDTEAHARNVEHLFGLPPGLCGAVWVGAEVEHFSATRAPVPPRQSGSPLQVLFYGQFIPLHGIRTIVEAARVLAGEPVEWTLIGRGQEGPEIRRLLDQTPLPKLRWIEWVNYVDLRNWIERADLCLGIFGTSAKAASVIPNKVFQIVAAGRPVVTRDSPAIRELLAHQPPCSYLLPCGDAQALAAAVRAHVAANVVTSCHAALAAKIDAAAIGRQLIDLIRARLPSAAVTELST
jgi:glycosyltransferase involved in cell wall biosynthesis